MREQLRDALFLQDTPIPPERPIESVPGSTAFLLLKGRPGKLAFWTAVLRELRDVDLGGPAIRVYRNITRLGAAPFTVFRTRPALRFLGSLWDRPTPPYFDAHVMPHFDGMIELIFPDVVDHSVLALVERLRLVCEEVVTWECDRRYVIIPSPSTTADSVFLTVIPRTPWNRTRKDAQHYWIEKHAPLVFDNADHTRMCGYEQVHTTLATDSPFDNTYEGVAYIEFRCLRDFLLQSLRPDTLRFNNTLVVDEMNLTVNSEISLFRRYEISGRRRCR